MSDKPIGEIVGRHDKASPSEPAVTETVTKATPATNPVVETTTRASETPVGGGQTSETPDPIHGLKSALGKERERADRFEKDWKVSSREQKRLAQQLEAMNRELMTMREASSKPDPKALEDKFFGGPAGFVTEQVSASEQRVYQALLNERIAMSRELAMHQYEDFAEAEEAFIEACKKDPALGAEADKSRMPALVAYREGKKILSAAKAAPAGSAGEDRIAKLEAEIAALRAGRDGGQTSAEAGTATAAAQKPSIPRSNVGVRGSGVGKTTSWAGPTPIDSVFGRQRRSAR